GSCEIDGGGSVVDPSGGHSEAADPRRGGRGGAWHPAGEVGAARRGGAGAPTGRARAEASPASSTAPWAARGAAAAAGMFASWSCPDTEALPSPSVYTWISQLH
ncbi:unnamed protein product, partial [Urochloa humidicola]